MAERFKTPPYPFQLEDLERSADREGFGLLWEQGLGKAKALVDTAAHLHRAGKIRALVLVAPNGVHANFIGELRIHCPDDVPWHGLTYYSSRASTKRFQREVDQLLAAEGRSLRVLAISYDALNTANGFALAQQMVTTAPALMALDESQAIKEPSSVRSKKVHLLGKHARYRRIYSGTPLETGPFDIFNQMRFLYPTFWQGMGLGSFWVFKQEFATFRQARNSDGHAYQQLLQYRDLDRLRGLIAPHVSRRLKDEVGLQLPPKTYTRATFELAPAQRKAYDQVREEIRLEVEDGAMEPTTALVRLTRLQQIASGYAVVTEPAPYAVGEPVVWSAADRVVQGAVDEVLETTVRCRGRVTTEDGAQGDEVRMEFTKGAASLLRLTPPRQRVVDLVAPKDNPRLQLLLALLDGIAHKVIVWARFRRDVDLVCEALGERAVRYDGSVKDADRVEVLRRFREDDAVRVLVANPAAISMGVTLTVAKTVIYYTNSFRLIERLQSEDRAHRIGQDQPVQYVDLNGVDTVDVYISDKLIGKFDLVSFVMGDRAREWIR